MERKLVVTRAVVARVLAMEAARVAETAVAAPEVARGAAKAVVPEVARAAARATAAMEAVAMVGARVLEVRAGVARAEGARVLEVRAGVARAEAREAAVRAVAARAVARVVDRTGVKMVAALAAGVEVATMVVASTGCIYRRWRGRHWFPSPGTQTGSGTPCMWGHKGTPHQCTLRTVAEVVATKVAVATRAVAVAGYGTHSEFREVGRVVLREAPGVAKAMDSAGAQGEPSAAVATSHLVAWGQAVGPLEARAVASVADSSSTRVIQGRLLPLPGAASARCRPSARSPCSTTGAARASR
jgi:hypothetical protein